MQLYLAAAPCYLPEARRWGLPIAHAAYRIDSGGRLAALALPPEVQGGLLLVTGTDCAAPPQPEALARDILRECLHRQYTGVVLEPVLTAAAVTALESLCRRYGRTLYVPERCGGQMPDVQVVVSTALSGGTLRRRLEEVCRRFGPRRIALDLACVRADFSLPAPYGDGRMLTAQQLASLRAQRPVFFSPELCARYFTYEQDGMTHLVLFDDADTLRRKIGLGTELGIAAGMLSLPEAAEALPGLLGKK